MGFMDVLGRCERSELSQIEAMELLGIGERTFRRWRDRHRETGFPGLSDRRLTPSLRRASVTEIERMRGLYRDLYRGFTVKHFHEQMLKRHNYVLCYTVTKLYLQREGLVQCAKKRSAHRKKRPRRPMVGMMLHQDASMHAWLPGNPRKYDLVVTMEDATCHAAGNAGLPQSRRKLARPRPIAMLNLLCYPDFGLRRCAVVMDPTRGLRFNEHLQWFEPRGNPSACTEIEADPI
jgi:Helix-turn-helix domain